MIRAVLIDDDLHSREVLQGLLARTGHEVQLTSVCSSAEEGKKAIVGDEPDIVFLDVEMPGMTGFDLLNELGRISFDIVFITAHQSYALKAIKASALDFLLKPVGLSDLNDALIKHLEKRNTANSAAQVSLLQEMLSCSLQEIKMIAVPTVTSLEFIKVNDIIRIEASHNYSTIFLKDKSQLLVSKTLKHFEDLLQETGFCRVHTSHLINLRFVRRYIKGAGGEVILQDGSSVEVSRNRKEDFLKDLQVLARG